MSRIAKKPVPIPSGVQVAVEGDTLAVKGSKGSLRLPLHPEVEVRQEDGALRFAPRSERRTARAMAGTLRSLAANMVHGVSRGFEKRLELVGVGYRAQVQGKVLSLSLGFSHPINYPVPEGISIETPSQTEIVVRGIDKQRVGQVAAEIRAFRPPEPYKGKGIKYAEEVVVRKEAKKK